MDFDTAESFQEGLAAVRVDGKYGFVDMHGNFAVEPIFDYALSFRHGLAFVILSNESMYIDHQFQQIIPFHQQGSRKKNNFYGKVKEVPEK